ncbi:hypothetical protein ILUMI_23721 [Ignelater luminosus]|uniref:Endonuclease/exonuclease/phosphatase domain-containing protein n=1 Tax=Ignelater luminosus TaxID=2038154 RepID=A0A8K0CAE4_IGNLU|nr:hypothetical protein ILUMI_23721 [Ignelater luminosus]
MMIEIPMSFRETQSAVVGVAYRPEWVNVHDFLDALEHSIADILPGCDKVILTEDFNIDQFRLDNNKTISLLNFTELFSLSQIINIQTRVTYSTQTLLDLIIVSKRDLVLESGVEGTYDISDHHLVFCKILLDLPRDFQIRTYRDSRNCNTDDFCTDFANNSVAIYG